jgi:hypothetical protein
MYRALGNLGQSMGFNAYANAVPGQQYVLNFSVSLESGSPYSPVSLFQTALANFPLFLNGALVLGTINAVGNTVSVTITANAGAASVTLGGIESSIAGWVNSQSGETVNPLDMQGGGTTSFISQFEQEGGITLSPFAPTTPGGTNWLSDLLGIGGGGSPPNPGQPFPWKWALAAGFGLVVIVIALR